jgi:hypothetical protein
MANVGFQRMADLLTVTLKSGSWRTFSDGLGATGEIAYLNVASPPAAPRPVRSATSQRGPGRARTGVVRRRAGPT